MRKAHRAAHALNAVCRTLLRAKMAVPAPDDAVRLVTAQLLAPAACSHALTGCFTGAAAQTLLGRHNVLQLHDQGDAGHGDLVLEQRLWGNLLQARAFPLPQDAGQKAFLVGVLCHAVFMCCIERHARARSPA